MIVWHLCIVYRWPSSVSLVRRLDPMCLLFPACRRRERMARLGPTNEKELGLCQCSL